MNIRVGHGFDVHAFEAGESIVLGGVHIAHSQALKAHSDGDVALHALCDALLGAAGFGDIGKHFPDTDARYAGISSRDLLRKVMDLLSNQGYLVANVDMTIVAQAPKLAPYIEAMRANIAEDLASEISRVNVKATTTEGLGYTGREEGIAAHAVVLIQNNNGG